MNKNVLNIQIKTDAFKRFKETLPPTPQLSVQVEHGLLCPDLMSRIELCEHLAWSDTNISHRAIRTSRMERCERLAWSDANISHRAIRNPRMELYEPLVQRFTGRTAELDIKRHNRLPVRFQFYRKAKLVHPVCQSLTRNFVPTIITYVFIP